MQVYQAAGGNIRRGRDGGLVDQVAGGNSRQGARWWAGISGGGHGRGRVGWAAGWRWLH